MKLKSFKQNINGYSDEDEAIKQDYLNASRRFLRAIAKDLAASGYTESKIHSNPAGPAVSGETYGEFHKPHQDVGVFVELCQSCCGPICNGRPADNIVIRAVWRCRTRQRMHTPEGPNTWLSIDNKDSSEISYSFCY